MSQTAVNPHSKPPSSPAAMLKTYWRNWRLMLQLVQREVISRYRGSIMGLTWSFFHPLLMLMVYTFVFSVVFKARWAGTEGGHAGFAVFLFVGLIVHGIFAESINRAPSLILANTNYVKRVVFPLEILTGVAMGSALFHAFVSLLVLLVVQMFDSGIPVTAIYFPLVLVPLVLMTMGLAWGLAAMGVYIRDIGYVVQVITTIMMYVSPVFFPTEAMPEAYRHWMYINPLTFIIEQSRSVLILGGQPNWLGLIGYTAIGLVVAWMGFWCFQKMRRGFADVL